MSTPPSCLPGKVVRVITRLNIGGPAQHVVLLNAHLPQKGWPSVLVTGRVEAHEGDMSDFAAAHDIVPITVAALRNGAWPGADLAAAVSLYRLFRRERPVIAHLHLFKARLLGGTAARLAGVPLVVETFHGTLLAEYYNPLARRVILGLERWLARRMDALIAVSDAVAEELVQWRIAPREKVHVIPLGLSLEKFLQAGPGPGGLRADLGIPAGALLVGTVGRLVPIKGLGFFVEAAADIVRWIPRAHFVIVGDGPERETLERQVWSRSLGGQVHFVGWRRDVERIYPDLDVVMLTSLHEGTPVSLIEAMTAGRAVVATRVGGVPDVVRDEETGLLVPAKDASALAAAAGRLLNDESLRRRMGEAARLDVYPRFTAGRLARDVDAFYRTLLAQRRPGR